MGTVRGKGGWGWGGSAGRVARVLFSLVEPGFKGLIPYGY